MRSFKSLMISLLTLITACLLPIAASAKAINLYEEPKDNAKIIGTIELSSGIVSIYTPKDGLWMKVGDPNNGSTGWIKSSELKDSNGNVISVTQKISEGNNGSKTQSMEMMYGQPLTPEQKKAMQELIIRKQQDAAKSMMMLQKSLEEVKQLYKQEVDIMQSIGFPVVPGMGTTPTAPAANTTVTPNTKTSK